MYTNEFSVFKPTLHSLFHFLWVKGKLFTIKNVYMFASALEHEFFRSHNALIYFDVERTSGPHYEIVD